MEEYVIETERLCKKFKSADGEVSALDNVNLKIKRGGIFGIIGFSGAGKSTLVRCFNKLETPDSGRVAVLGKDVSALKGRSLIALRRKAGMIFQNFNLLNQRTVLKNVTFPLEAAGERFSKCRARAEELLNEVGLGDKASSYPAQLSGGQKQRAAIARALALGPEILLCDEATSALDPETAAKILSLIKNLNVKYNLTIVIISHQLGAIRSVCDEVAVLDKGRICETGTVESVFANPVSDAAKRLIAYEGGGI